MTAHILNPAKCDTSLEREQAIAARAVKLLQNGCGVTRRYAEAALECELIESDELRGAGTGTAKRWFLA